ncbi:MAG: hypothetical protein ABF288_01920 [Octadecabacter sp.]
MIKTPFTVALLCIASLSSAQTALGTTVSFDQQLDAFTFSDGTIGFYSQGWTGQLSHYISAGYPIFEVTGEGKLGDFQGTLLVDCPVPSGSSWSDVKGGMGPDQVPIDLILQIRETVC